MGKLIIQSKFAQTPNSLINDKNISLRAKGLFAFLQSKPDNWQFSTERIASQLKEGKDAVRRALQELQEHGYLERKLIYDHQNKKISGYDYFLYVIPKKADDRKTNRLETNHTENQTTGKSDDISKKEIRKKDKVKNIEEREQIFFKNLATFKDKYPDEMLKDFFLYWTEKNRNGKKMRFEMEKTWDLSRRLAKWHSNELKFEKRKKVAPKKEKRKLATYDREEAMKEYIENQKKLFPIEKYPNFYDENGEWLGIDFM